MEIEVQLTTQPITAGACPDRFAGRAGAWARFVGTVRGEEAGREVAALEYEAYSPMAEREIRRLIEELALCHPCLCARVVHRIGIIPVGEAAIIVEVASAHRGEAFRLLTEFMDRLKLDVPIWKCRGLTLAEVEEIKGR